MELKIYKKNDDILTEIINDDGTSEEFTNLKMIDYMYKNRDKKINLNFSEDISEEEKNKITSTFEKIETLIIKTKEDNIPQ